MQQRTFALEIIALGQGGEIDGPGAQSDLSGVALLIIGAADR